MMIHSRLSIVTETAAGESVFECDCLAECSPAAWRAEYTNDGDLCRLRADRHALFMERKGPLTLRASFSEGERTILALAGQGTSSELPVVTERYRFGPSLAELVYTLGDEAARFHLMISLSEQL